MRYTSTMRHDKQVAVSMRRDGWSYSDITKRLGIPKSTLSGWMKDIPFRPNQTVVDRVKSGQGKYGMVRHQLRIQEVERLKKQGENEIGKISNRDLLMLGIGLWLGEGSKTLEQIRLVNSDPDVIQLFLKWFRVICSLDDKNITASMHLYPDSRQDESLQYWMSITGLPKSQFRKTQIDRRLGKSTLKIGKNQHGTLHIGVVSNGDPDKGVRLYRRVKGWVSGALR